MTQRQQERDAERARRRRPFEDVAVDDVLPELSWTITREQIREYAEASGDDNALHLDDDVARAVGIDGVIAHGMLTMGILASCIVGWAGDEGALVKLKSPFRATVAPGETVVAGGRVRSLHPEERTAKLEIWVRSERADGSIGDPIRRSEALVRLG
ncbi:MAG: MaoC/PaaZ C-terminal domain-containing protein [Actinomycetota bacterium]